MRRELLESAEQLLSKLEGSGQEDTTFLFNRTASHVARGDLALTHDDLNLATKEYQAAVQIMKGLVKEEPDNTHWLSSLSVSYEKLGDVAVAAGRLDDARQAYEQGLQIRKALAAQDPHNAGWQRDLLISHLKFIGLLVQTSNPSMEKILDHLNAAETILKQFEQAGLMQDDAQVIKIRDAVATLRAALQKETP